MSGDTAKAIALAFTLAISMGGHAYAASIAPILYQARILTPSGKPLERASTFQFTIRAPNSCILWSEDHSLNLAGSKGAISVEIGNGPNIAPGSHSFTEVFRNSGTLTGLSGCASGSSYAPVSIDDRTLFVSFNDGSSVQALPPLAIKSVPYSHFATVAHSALSLMGIEIETSNPPTDGQVLTYNQASNRWVASTMSAGGAGFGTVTSVAVTGNPIFTFSGGPITTAGTINLGLANQSANRVLASPNGVAGAPTFRALTAGDIPGLPASQLTAGTLGVTRGGTGLVPGPGNANQVYGVDATGATAEFKSLVAGSGITVNTTTPGQITISASSGGSGTVTNVDLSMPSLFSVAGGPITTAGTIGVTLNSQTQNLFLASPSGASGVPAFRGIAAADLPSIPASLVGSGTLSSAVGGVGLIPTVGNANQLIGVNAGGTNNEYKTLVQGSGVNITNSGGTITIAATGSGGTVTQINTGTGLSGGPITGNGTISLADTAVTAGSYGALNYVPTFTVDQQGRLTGAGSLAIGINASQVTAGTFAFARLGILDASLVGSGTLDLARIGALPAAQITSGTFALARIPQLDASQVVTGTFAATQIPNLDASKITSGTMNSAQIGIVNVANGGTGLTTFGAPGQVLQSNGSTSLGWVSQWQNAGGNLYFNTGSIAINRASPSSELDINGTLRVTQICDESGGNCKTVSGGWGAGGSVTNVGLSGNSLFNISGGPVTTAGTFNLDLASQAANLVLAAPNGSAGIPSFRSLDGADIATGTFALSRIGNLPASQITSGTFATARLGTFDTSLVTTGTFAFARLGILDASIIGTGTLNLAQVGSLPASQIASGTFATARIPQLDASQVVTGTFSATQIPNLDASKITTGTLGSAVGGTGLVPAPGNANQVIGVNATGSGNEYKSVVQGSGVSIISTAGTITIAATGSGGTVTQVNTGTGLSGGPITTTGTISLADTAVTAAAYGGVGNYIPSFVVDQQGRLTSAGSTAVSIDAAAVSSGTLATARIGVLDTSILGTGTLATAILGVFDASLIATGTLTTARLGVLDASLVSTGTLNLAQIGNLPASTITTGTFATAQLGSIPASLLSGTLSLANGGSQWENVAVGITYNTGGSVAIGRATPAALLDVNGTMRVTQICDESGANCKTVSGGWGAGGSVTNVGLGGNSIFNITGGPVTTAGTFNLDLASQSANLVLAAPNGSAGVPSFRALDAADLASGTLALARIGNLPASTITDGTFATARIPQLDASQVVSGSFTAGQIPNLDAAKITTGTLGSAVGGVGLVPSAGSANQVIGVNAAGSDNEYKALVQGAGVSIVNTAGTITIAATGSGGTVTQVSTGTGLSGGPITGSGTISLADTAVTPGSYGAASHVSTFTVDQQGRLTSAGSTAIAIAAAAVSSGTLATARIGLLPATSLSGTLAAAQFGLVPAENGGTGLNASSASAGQILVGNGAGFTLSTIQVSNGLTQTLSAGTIALSTNAQSTNSNNTLIIRDGSGGFAAGNASLQGLTLQGLGTVSISTPATANYSMTLPASNSSGFLQNNGSGVLSWGNAATQGGTIAAAPGSASLPSYTFTGNFGSGLWSPGSGSLAISANGTEAIRIRSDGNVGIGTTNPTMPLDVASGIGINSGYWKVVNDTNNSLIINAEGTSFFENLTDSPTIAYQFKTGSSNTPKVSILTNGSVGVGTTSPAALLDVAGAARSSSHVFAGAGTASILPPTSGNYSMSLPASIGAPGQVLATDGTSALSWTSFTGISNGGTFAAAAGSASAPSLTFTGNFGSGMWSPGSGSLAISTGGIERVRVDGNGNIGIGTSTPSVLIDVFSSAAENSNGQAVLRLGGNNGSIVGSGPKIIFADEFGNDTASIRGYYESATNVGLDFSTSLTTSAMHISGSGNVGIGTTTPAALLHVAGSSRSSSHALSSSGTVTLAAPTSGNYTLTFPSSAGTAGQILSTDGTSALSWTSFSGISNGGTFAAAAGSAAAPSMTFTGNFGSGLWSPGSGSLSISTGGSERIRVDSSGQVGIGTTNPQSDLHVVGDVRADFIQAKKNWANNEWPFSISDLANYVSFYVDMQGGEANKIYGSGQSGAFSIESKSGNAIALIPGGTEQFRVTSTGSVGIGTTSPLARLHVAGTSRSTSHALVGAGTVTLAPPASGNYSLTFPSTVGSSGQVLTTDGTSALSWTSFSGVAQGGTFAASAGTAALPSHTFTGNFGSGMWSPGSGTLAFSNSGIESIRLDGSGNLGVGTPSPSTKLHVAGSAQVDGQMRLAPNSAAAPAYAFDGAASSGMYYPGGTSGIAFSVAGTERLRIASSGNVGIGTTSPIANLEVQAGSTSFGDGIAVAPNGSGYGGYFWRDSAGTTTNSWAFTRWPGNSLNLGLQGLTGMQGTPSGSTVFTITPTGQAIFGDRVGIGTGTPSAALHVVGDIVYTGSITDISDRRQKENIEPLASGLDVITRIPTYAYSMKNDPQSKIEFGVMAQDVKEVLPELVRSVDPNGDTMGITYQGFIPWLMKAVQELNEKVENRCASDKLVAELKAANQKLERRVQSLETEMQEIREQLKMLRNK